MFSTTPFISAVGIILAINCCWCSPLSTFRNTDANPDLPPKPQKIELTKELEQSFYNGSAADTTPFLECSTDDFDPSLQPFNGIKDPRFRWTNFNVFIDPAYSSSERTLINNAVYRLSLVLPCVRFGIWSPGSSPSGDYVHVRKGSGCSSVVGKRGGSQGLTLASPGCMHNRIVLHEMMHALGLHHEQSRPDRDDFVTVHWENISPGTEHNFNKYGWDYVDTFGVGYNQRSIMHYGGNDFSRNGRPTITAKNGGTVGPSNDLQQTDIDKLKRMYNC